MVMLLAVALVDIVHHKHTLTQDTAEKVKYQESV